MSPSHEKAYFGAGCFWGVEHRFHQIPGVISAISGYAAGHTENPTYEQVCTDTTGHAEVVEVTFDSTQTSYAELLEVFWAMHDPTTPNRQGPDHGSQYRSILLTTSDEQRSTALASRTKAQPQHIDPIVTEIEPLTRFWPAEEYHQRYFGKRGIDVMCH